MNALTAWSPTQPLRGFFSWWGAELAGMLPASVMRRTALPDAVLLDDAGTGLRVSIRRRGREGTLGTLGADVADATLRRRGRGLPVHLRIADDSVLRRELALPLDAEATLRQAIAFRIDGLTPFKPDEVCFGYRRGGVDRRAGMLSVLLAVVPKNLLTPLLERAGENGLDVAAVETVVDGAPVLVPLEEPAADEPRGRGAARLFVLLLLLAALLGGAAAYIPIYRLERHAADLRGAVEQARESALATERLREKLARIGEAGQFFADRKAPDRLFIGVLDELTRRLPDSAWLAEFQADEKEIVISGFATNASSLLGDLEASPKFANTRFRSPVTRDGNDDLEHFELSSDIVWRRAK